MSVFKCKMCGGELEFAPGAAVALCPYCGSRQTLPKLDSDKRRALYERANHFRRLNEYDKAAALYDACLSKAKRLVWFGHGGHSRIRVTDPMSFDAANPISELVNIREYASPIPSPTTRRSKAFFRIHTATDPRKGDCGGRTGCVRRLVCPITTIII